MKKSIILLAMLTCAVSPYSLSAQDNEAPISAPSPNEIVEKAAAEDWVAISPSDLLVMDLVPDADGNARRVIIQLMPEPFSQGWIRNIRKLAAAKWWDGTSINRVQDNYVVQWGDADYDNPESGGEAKTLPADLETVPESDYETNPTKKMRKDLAEAIKPKNIDGAGRLVLNPDEKFGDYLDKTRRGDAYAGFTYHHSGWRLASNFTKTWPVHCYGMVGVGRNLSPDTGTGAELYTVIGHAPRHLDRNIALVGRVIEGIEHMSSLPRGKGQLGFYEDPAKRVPILSVRIGKTTSSSEAVGEQTTSSSAAVGEQTTSSSAAVGEQTTPRFEYLSTESKTFAAYARARANRRDPFFNVPAGGADICNIPVPIRRVED